MPEPLTHNHDLITPAAAVEALRGQLASLVALADGQGSPPNGPLMGDLLPALRLAIRRLVSPPGEGSKNVILHASGVAGPLPADGLIPPGREVWLTGHCNYAFKPGYLVTHAVDAAGTMTPCRWPVLDSVIGDNPLRGGSGLYDGGDYPIALMGHDIRLKVVNPGPAAAGLRAELIGVIPEGCLSRPPTCGYLVNDAAAAELRAQLADVTERLTALERGRVARGVTTPTAPLTSLAKLELMARMGAALRPPTPEPQTPPPTVGSAPVSRVLSGGRRAHASHGTWMPATPAARRAPASAHRPWMIPTRAFITLLVTLVLLIAAALAAGRQP